MSIIRVRHVHSATAKGHKYNVRFYVIGPYGVENEWEKEIGQDKTNVRLKEKGCTKWEIETSAGWTILKQDEVDRLVNPWLNELLETFSLSNAA